MKEYLNKGIKEIMDQFPIIADILNEYNIGCTACNIGTCLLKDVVEIHNLSPKQQEELFTRIFQVIYGDHKIEISQVKRDIEVKPQEIKYSPPIKKLVNEHILIKRWLELIPNFIKSFRIEKEEYQKLLLDGIDFIRSYADKYHHAKEENILFKYFDENLDVLRTMLEEHEKGRGFAREALEALSRRDRETIIKNLYAYRELLTEHIKKEDEILYPWMDRNLSVTQIGELFSKFNNVDEDFALTPKKHEEFIEQLEEKFKLKEVEKL